MSTAEPTALVERGLDALEALESLDRRRGLGRRVVTAAAPPLVAVGTLLAVWQIVSLSGWKPDYVLPSPGSVWQAFSEQWRAGHITQAVWTSLSRCAIGFAISLAVGTPLALLMARVRPVRLALGSLLAGLQSLPSVAWVPAGIIWFGLTERAILFVVVMGALPSIVNGLMSAVDAIPPTLLRAGRAMGAHGIALYRHVVLPAALPGYVAGMKQAWAFAWRSLMAAELITLSPDLGLGLGQLLDSGREQIDMPLVIMSILVILVVGVGVHSLVLGPLERRTLRVRGLRPA